MIQCMKSSVLVGKLAAGMCPVLKKCSYLCSACTYKGDQKSESMSENAFTFICIVVSVFYTKLRDIL